MSKMAEYRIEDCTLYRKSCVISGVPVYIFEDHNMALPAWGTVCSRIGSPVNLVTFDFHTDTLFGFRTHIYEETGELPDVWNYGLKNPIVKELLNGVRYDIVNIGLHFFLKNVRPYAASCNES